MQFSRARKKNSLSFEVGRIGDATIDRAYRGAGFVIVEADAFGAF
jgi:proline racemase